MGAIEQGGKIAASVVDTFKAHPLVLALVLMNIGLLIIIWLEFDQIFRQQKEVNALLSKCVDADILRSLGLFK